MLYPFFKQRGQISLQLLIYITVMVILIGGFILWAGSFLNISLRDYNKAQAFTIAEAGIEYYRWHLAHAPQDYQDGTGQPGPYVHNYYDKDGNLVGSFKLEITPPPTGTTIVTVRSAGQVASDPSVEKIIEVRMGIPSLAKYAVAVNQFVRFGEGTEVWGEIISNGGIRFDGLAHNLVSSAQSSFDDPDHSGGNEFGVHTHVSPTDPLPPAAVPLRPDVFEVGRQFPVPALDFVGLTQNLSDIRDDAIAEGFHRTSSTAMGYEIILKTDDTFDLNRVNTLVAAPSGCTNYLSQSGWGTWSIQSTTSLGTFPLPTNGLIFLEDHIWVRGQIDGARITIGSGVFPDNPTTRTSITINNDLLYTNYDGSDVLSLIAQNNINVGLQSEDDLRVDAALVAQNGRIGRYYYRPPGGGSNRCSPYHVRSVITSYGMIATNLRYGFAYTDNTGYDIRNLNYDANLLYGPPPSFPLTNDQYEIISWDEIK
ncbi:MAG: hypothetical protein KGZ30_04490 [Anaplasmataceae bacterium]|nr:hypothetical protein [Anaplasmataceae bacterium]